MVADAHNALPIKLRLFTLEQWREPVVFCDVMSLYYWFFNN